MFASAILAATFFFASGQAPSSSLAFDTCDAGEAYVFSAAECEIGIENPGDKSVRIYDIVGENTDDRPGAKELVVAPHSRAYLKVHIKLDHSIGPKKHFFKLRTDESGRPEVRVTAYNFGLSMVDAKPEIEFGVVDMTQPRAERSLEIESHDVADFRAVRIISAPAWLDAHLSGDGRMLTARIRDDAPLGLYADFIKLELNARAQPAAWISVAADIHGDVVPQSNPIVMGLLRANSKNEFLIPLTSRSGKPFTVERVTLDSVEGDVKVGNCIPDKVGCKWVTLVVSNKQQLGTLKGNLFVDLGNEHKKLKIALRGLLVDKDFKVKTLDPNEAMQNSGKSLASSSVDVSKAIKSAVDAAAEATPPGHGPLLKWTVANGLIIHGFQIFRSASENGPFVLLNQTSVHSKATDEAAATYQWRDDSAEAGKEYWYYIGIVYGDGHKQRLTSPQKVIAK